MDFENMKRKDLQSMCKKHGIPANLKNSEMADRLALLFKEKEELGASKQQSYEELGSNSDSRPLTRKGKKVRFSPETEVFEFKDSGSKYAGAEERKSRRVSIVKPGRSKFTSFSPPVKRKRDRTVSSEPESEMDQPGRVLRRSKRTTVKEDSSEREDVELKDNVVTRRSNKGRFSTENHNIELKDEEKHNQGKERKLRRQSVVNSMLKESGSRSPPVLRKSAIMVDTETGNDASQPGGVVRRSDRNAAKDEKLLKEDRGQPREKRVTRKADVMIIDETDNDAGQSGRVPRRSKRNAAKGDILLKEDGGQPRGKRVTRKADVMVADETRNDAGQPGGVLRRSYRNAAKDEKLLKKDGEPPREKRATQKDNVIAMDETIHDAGQPGGVPRRSKRNTEKDEMLLKEDGQPREKKATQNADGNNAGQPAGPLRRSNRNAAKDETLFKKSGQPREKKDARKSKTGSFVPESQTSAEKEYTQANKQKRRRWSIMKSAYEDSTGTVKEEIAKGSRKTGSRSNATEGEELVKDIEGTKKEGTQKRGRQADKNTIKMESKSTNMQNTQVEVPLHGASSRDKEELFDKSETTVLEIEKPEMDLLLDYTVEDTEKTQQKEKETTDSNQFTSEFAADTDVEGIAETRTKTLENAGVHEVSNYHKAEGSGFGAIAGQPEDSKSESKKENSQEEATESMDGLTGILCDRHMESSTVNLIASVTSRLQQVYYEGGNHSEGQKSKSGYGQGSDDTAYGRDICLTNAENVITGVVPALGGSNSTVDGGDICVSNDDKEFNDVALASESLMSRGHELDENVQDVTPSSEKVQNKPPLEDPLADKGYTECDTVTDYNIGHEGTCVQEDPTDMKFQKEFVTDMGVLTGCENKIELKSPGRTLASGVEDTLQKEEPLAGQVQLRHEALFETQVQENFIDKGLNNEKVPETSGIDDEVMVSEEKRIRNSQNTAPADDIEVKVGIMESLEGEVTLLKEETLAGQVQSRHEALFQTQVQENFVEDLNNEKVPDTSGIDYEVMMSEEKRTERNLQKTAPADDIIEKVGKMELLEREDTLLEEVPLAGQVQSRHEALFEENFAEKGLSNEKVPGASGIDDEVMMSEEKRTERNLQITAPEDDIEEKVGTMEPLEGEDTLLKEVALAGQVQSRYEAMFETQVQENFVEEGLSNEKVPGTSGIDGEVTMSEEKRTERNLQILAPEDDIEEKVGMGPLEEALPKTDTDNLQESFGTDAEDLTSGESTKLQEITSRAEFDYRIWGDEPLAGLVQLNCDPMIDTATDFEGTSCQEDPSNVKLQEECKLVEKDLTSAGDILQQKIQEPSQVAEVETEEPLAGQVSPRYDAVTNDIIQSEESCHQEDLNNVTAVSIVDEEVELRTEEASAGETYTRHDSDNDNNTEFESAVKVDLHSVKPMDGEIMVREENQLEQRLQQNATAAVEDEDKLAIEETLAGQAKSLFDAATDDITEYDEVCVSQDTSDEKLQELLGVDEEEVMTSGGNQLEQKSQVIAAEFVVEERFGTEEALAGQVHPRCDTVTDGSTLKEETSVEDDPNDMKLGALNGIDKLSMQQSFSEEKLSVLSTGREPSRNSENATTTAIDATSVHSSGCEETVQCDSPLGPGVLLEPHQVSDETKNLEETKPTLPDLSAAASICSGGSLTSRMLVSSPPVNEYASFGDGAVLQDNKVFLTQGEQIDDPSSASFSSGTPIKGCDTLLSETENQNKFQVEQGEGSTEGTPIKKENVKDVSKEGTVAEFLLHSTSLISEDAKENMENSGDGFYQKTFGLANSSEVIISADDSYIEPLVPDRTPIITGSKGKNMDNSREGRSKGSLMQFSSFSHDEQLIDRGTVFRSELVPGSGFSNIGYKSMGGRGEDCDDMNDRYSNITDKVLEAKNDTGDSSLPQAILHCSEEDCLEEQAIDLSPECGSDDYDQPKRGSDDYDLPKRGSDDIWDPKSKDIGVTVNAPMETVVGNESGINEDHAISPQLSNGDNEPERNNFNDVDAHQPNTSTEEIWWSPRQNTRRADVVAASLSKSLASVDIENKDVKCDTESPIFTQWETRLLSGEVEQDGGISDSGMQEARLTSCESGESQILQLESDAVQERLSGSRKKENESVRAKELAASAMKRKTERTSSFLRTPKKLPNISDMKENPSSFKSPPMLASTARNSTKRRPLEDLRKSEY